MADGRRAWVKTQVFGLVCFDPCRGANDEGLIDLFRMVEHGKTDFEDMIVRLPYELGTGCPVQYTVCRLLAGRGGALVMKCQKQLQTACSPELIL